MTRTRNNQRDPFAGQSTAVTVLDQTAVELYYDYNKVDEANRDAVRRAAINIKPRLKRAAEDLFVIGKDLQAMKSLLPHGEYVNWLSVEFGLSVRMAQRFVAVYERLGFKSDIMSFLPPTILYLLSAPSTPDEAIEQVQQQLDAHRPISVAAVQQVINEAKKRVVDAQETLTDEGFIEGEISARTEGEGEGEQTWTRAQRLEMVLSEVLSLLGEQALGDWAVLVGNHELGKVQKELMRLKAVVQRGDWSATPPTKAE